MDESLRERLAAVRHALEVVNGLLIDAETHALEKPTREGLLKARATSTRIQAWISSQEVKCIR